MPMINLLPWREELRQKRKKDFLLAVLGAVLMGVVLTFGTKLFYQSRISYQDERNDLLRNEIAELNQQIDEINELEAQKSRLLDRMEIIELLQRSRPESVHLMDETVDILPEGTRLTALNQDGTRIQVIGIVQSSARVSALMRNVDQSEWLREPWLEGVEYSGSGATRDGEFILFADQVGMENDEGAL